MDRQELIRLYYQMVLIRRLEERSAELYQQDKIGGFLHLYIGQEAVGVGVVSARRPQDHVITAYRDHGIAIACGLTAEEVIAELLGKETGCSKGMGGSMHLADVDKRFWGGYAIVGGHLPLATGLALAEKYRGTDTATICFFGDGSTNIGYFHEALNLSKVWDLAVLWVCENNQYGMGTAVERASAVSEIRRKAEGYGMANAQVDGMDVLAVRQATLEALERVRQGEPFFLEAMTYRFRGHSMGDPERYRTGEEVRKWQEGDPIGRFYDHLLKEKIADQAALEAEEARAEKEVEQAVRFAEASPDPSPEQVYDLVYVK